jgi:hypothetical protein
MGEASARVRAMKAKALQAADDYNASAKAGFRIAWAQKKVLEFIVGCIARGRAWPSYELIAHHVGCCTDTVRIAIRNCARAGLLAWTNTWHWNRKAGRVTRTSNSYTLGNGNPAPVRPVTHYTEIPAAPQQASKISGASQVYVGKDRAVAPATELVEAIGELTAADFVASPSLLAVLKGVR